MNKKSEYQLKSYKYKLKFACLVVILCFLTISTFQSQTITFQKAIISSDNSYFNSIVQVNDDGYIAVGRKRVSFFEDYMYFVRFNKFGDTVWTKTVDREEAVSVTKTMDNKFVAIGVAGSFVKFDLNSNILILNNLINEDLRIQSICQISDSSYYICGEEFAGINYTYLAKLNNIGTLIWDSVNTFNDFTGRYGDLLYSNNSFIILTGNRQLSSGNPSFLFLEKRDIIGNRVWLNTLNTVNNLYPNSIFQTSSNSFIICAQAYLIKFDFNGNFLFYKNYNTTPLISRDYKSLTEASDKNYVLTGWQTNNNFDYVNIHKVDTNGNVIWSKLHGFDSVYHTPWNLKLTSDSGFVIAGRAIIFGEDPFILKLDENGDLLPPIGIINISEISTGFILNQNFPNPFNPITNISFKIPERTYIELKLYDINGKLLSTLFKKEMLPNEYKFEINAANLASGVYFVKFDAENNNGFIFTKTIKILLIK